MSYCSYRPKFGIYNDQLRSLGIITRRKETTRIISLNAIIDTKLKDHHHDRRHSVQLLGACDGLLMFHKYYYGFNKSRTAYKKLRRIFILNPITRETRNVKYPRGCVGYVSGIFFDRFKHDHTILHVSETDTSLVLYHIFRFTESAWRRIEITSIMPSTTLGHVCRIVPPCLHVCPPVIVADALHWIVDDYDDDGEKIVVAFKIETNEIYHIPHPRRQDPPQKSSSLACCLDDCCIFYFMEIKEEKKQLIEKNEKLCLCHIIFQSHQSHEIDMWILEEYGDPSSWIMKLKVKLPCGSSFRCLLSYFWGSVILSFHNNKDVIAMKWNRGKIYLYNLVTHESSWIDVSPMTGSFDYYRFIAFNRTLISPNIAYK